jgi:hypothetical protein
MYELLFITLLFMVGNVFALDAFFYLGLAAAPLFLLSTTINQVTSTS